MEKSEKNWKSEKNNQNIVMNEEFVKNSVMNGNIDPKVVMERSTFNIGGWNNFQPSSQHSLEDHVDENEPWLLIGIPNRDLFFVTRCLGRHFASSDQHVEELMSLREGLHVMMHCHKRQHFAHRYWLQEHPGGHASWRAQDEEIHTTINHVLRTRTCVQMECSEDAISIKCIRAQNNRFLHKQLENQNCLGELL